MTFPAGSNNVGANTFFSERSNVQKFQPVGVDTNNIYVDSVNGQDQSPGNGTQLTPYLTIPRAVKDAANLGLLEVARLILSGAASHILPDGYVFPTSSSSDLPGTEAGQPAGFSATGPMVIQAAPVLQLAIPVLNIIAQTPNPTSGLISLVTNLVLVPGAFSELWVVDSVGTVARIRSNDATTFLLCIASALVGPVEVYSASATIESSNPLSNNPTMYFRGSAQVVLQGLQVDPTNTSSLRVDNGQRLTAIACRLPDLTMGEPDAQSPGYLDLQACLLGNYTLNAGTLKISNSLSNDIIFGGSVVGFLRGVVARAVGSVFESMNSSLFSDGTFSVFSLSLTNCELRSCPARGVRQIGGSLFGSAVLIEGAAVAGIFLQSNAQALLDATAGLNTVGLQAESGAVALITATVTISGGLSNDYKVDGLPPLSNAFFRTGPVPFSVKGPLSGVIQGADTGFSRQAASLSTASPLNLSGANQFIFEDATAGAKVVVLPLIGGARGRVFFVAKSDVSANSVLVAPQPGETINGAALVVLSAQFQGLWVIAPDAGADWKILSLSTPSTTNTTTIPGALVGHDVQKVFGASPYTALASDLIIGWDTAGGPCVQNLPALATVRGVILWIAKRSADANTVTIDAAGAETIAGALTLVLGTVATAQLYAPLVGTDWMVL